MITKKTRFFLLILLMLALAACSGEETSDLAGDTVVTEPAAESEAAITPDIVEQPAEESVEQPPEEPAAAPTLEPTPTEAAVVAEAEPETADPQPTEAPAQESPAAETQFNGVYETTYFRGSETAPVTMIDYSDFL